MSIQLKSIQLLDGEETNVSLTLFWTFLGLTFNFYIKNARLKTMIGNSQRKTVKFAVPKRKKTYTKEEEMAEAQFKLSKMNIEQEHTRHDGAGFVSR